MPKLFFLCATVLITLFFGLYPKDFGTSHRPFINSSGDLAFTKYSVATAQLDLTADQAAHAVNVSLLIPEMPVKNNQFSTIFSLNNAQGHSEMLLGQWRNYLVVMSGNDFPNHLEQPRITVLLDSVQGYVYPQALRVVVEATQASTTFVINEQIMARSEDFIVPFQPGNYTVSLGNTLNRKQGWMGTLREFELLASNKESVKLPSNLTSDQTSPWVLQPALSVLSSVWLSTRSLQYGYTTAINKDVLVNFLGFLPVSLAIFIFLAPLFKPATTALSTVAASALTSLLIESAQVLIPSRTSSMLDLVVNSAAGALTALLCYVALIWLHKATDKELPG